MKNVNKSLFYVGPVISFFDNANVLLCNYAGMQVMILQKGLTKLSKFDSCTDLYYYCRLHWLSLG